MQLSPASILRLKGVHPDLVRVVERAAELMPEGNLSFRVTEGLRSKERQAELVAAGASQTMNSRHLTGHAVDLAAEVNGDVRWAVPRPSTWKKEYWPLYDKLGWLMKKAAGEVGVPIEWGGDWKMRDGPHFQLPWKRYP